MLSNYGADSCPNCGHAWHGLRCSHGMTPFGGLVLVRQAPICDCPSSFKEDA